MLKLYRIDFKGGESIGEYNKNWVFDVSKILM